MFTSQTVNKDETMSESQLQTEVKKPHHSQVWTTSDDTIPSRKPMTKNDVPKRMTTHERLKSAIASHKMKMKKQWEEKQHRQSLMITD
jgi:hypothetical protein